MAPTTELDLPDATTETETEHSRLDALLDAAVTWPSGRVTKKVAEMRRKAPRATPEEIISRLEQEYVRSIKRTSGAVGAVAAVPAIGTGVAAVLTAANLAGFLGRTSTFVMAVAEVHGIHVEDVARRRTLLLTTLLGDEGVEALSGQVGLSTLGWARTALTRLPLGTVRGVNRGLTSRLARRAARRGGLFAVGRLAPFGVGAVIGWAGGKVLARNVVAAAEEAFGRPPLTFADAGDAITAG
ncbi:hypothetical protein [Georgenia faecalis]|uniref:EcsC family protein n=1 Tax=Georgenia faecalis TaxID=2483799 RepID=A0ABV9D663_9MICO|nr:hypothetical protein [Georgenia faecalis]